jgi:hypothetical protein
MKIQKYFFIQFNIFETIEKLLQNQLITEDEVKIINYRR